MYCSCSTSSRNQKFPHIFYVEALMCLSSPMLGVTYSQFQIFFLNLFKHDGRYTFKQRICSLCFLCVTVFAVNTTPCINTLNTTPCINTLHTALCLCFNSKPLYLLPSLFCHAAIIGPMLELLTWMMMMNFNKKAVQYSTVQYSTAQHSTVQVPDHDQGGRDE